MINKTILALAAGVLLAGSLIAMSKVIIKNRDSFFEANLDALSQTEQTTDPCLFSPFSTCLTTRNRNDGSVFIEEHVYRIRVSQKVGE